MKLRHLAVFVAALFSVFALQSCGEGGSVYKFEATPAAIGTGSAVRLNVRVIGPDQKPITPQSIAVTSTRLDMGPDGMANMAAPLKLIGPQPDGSIAFEAEISMAGRWALKIEATVAGEPVKGEVIYTAGKGAGMTAPSSDREIVYYRNPMGYADVSPVPKKDSMGMDYIPVFADEIGPPGSVRLTPEKVQRTGVVVAAVSRQTINRTIRGFGMIAPDERTLAVVTAKFDGIAEKLFVSATGAAVVAGRPLFSAWIVEPELLAWQADLIAAVQGGRETATTEAILRQFDVPPEVITEIAKTHRGLRTIPFNAPVSGTVIEKPVIAGAGFKTGETLFRIADLSSVWLMMEVAERDLPFIRSGQEVDLTLPSTSEQEISGKVDFIYPDLDATTRTAKARISIPNRQGDLKLGAFAHTRIEAALTPEPVIAIPLGALIDDGDRTICFVDAGEGRFEVRNLEIGARGDTLAEVKSGLKEGDRIVTAGNFLIDAESNLQNALRDFAVSSQPR